MDYPPVPEQRPGHDWASVKVKGTVAQWLKQWKALGCFVYIIPHNRQQRRGGISSLYNDDASGDKKDNLRTHVHLG